MLITEDDGLSCRWLQEYQLRTDSLLTRFDCILPVPGGWALQEPHQFNHIDRETVEFALEFYEGQIEECKRCARAQPGVQFSVNWHITHEEMAQRRYGAAGARIGQQLRVRLPADFQVREGPAVHYGHLYIRPEWHAGLFSDNPDERNAAYEKSLELLKSWLSPSQLKDYKKHNYFVVLGSDTGTHYRLVSERSYNILELDERGALTGQKFCVVPAQSVAMGDQLLAQKIWLETDERRTLKIANKIARTGQGARGNLGAINQIAREANQLFQNSNALLRNMPQYEELLGEPENARGTGRTSRQMTGAPVGAAFVWCNNRVNYAVGLAHELGRDDLRVLPLYMLNEQYRGLSGCRYPAIIVDHAAELTARGRSYLRELTARQRGPRTIVEG